MIAQTVAGLVCLIIGFVLGYVVGIAHVLKGGKA